MISGRLSLYRGIGDGFAMTFIPFFVAFFLRSFPQKSSNNASAAPRIIYTIEIRLFFYGSLPELGFDDNDKRLGLSEASFEASRQGRLG
jgi:hypothetical protein